MERRELQRQRRASLSEQQRAREREQAREDNFKEGGLR